MAGWLAGGLANSLGDWLAAQLITSPPQAAKWPIGWLAGWPMSWLAGQATTRTSQENPKH